MEMFSFEKLIAYQESRKLLKSIYLISRSFPEYERFALTSQLRRAVISVSSNIAEGCGRVSNKEKIHFLEIAFGSLLEAYSQLQIGLDLGYTSSNEIEKLKPQFFYVGNLINALRKSYIIKD